MFSWISKLLDRIFVVIGALVCIQIPLFMQQYRHQLIGRIDELSQQVEVMRQIAMESNKTLEQFIQKFVNSSDLDFSRQGELMQNMVIRWRSLSDGLFSIDHASIWIKPLIFLQNLDYNIAQSTLNNYQAGITLTYEGVIYALIGICAGYALYSILGSLIRRLKNIVFKPLSKKG